MVRHTGHDGTMSIESAADAAADEESQLLVSEGQHEQAAGEAGPMLL